MKIHELMTNTRDAISVRRVYGEPIQQNGVTVIPAANIGGGGGGGEGHDERGQEGEGGGFGVTARPAGAYVLSGDKVRWMPAVDVNRLVTVVGVVAIVTLLASARIAKAHAQARGQ